MKKTDISDTELILRLNNSGISKVALAEYAKISEAQLMLILNRVSIMNPKIRTEILECKELEHLW